MQTEEYRAMYELEDRLWWYAGMRAITAALLDRRPHDARGGRLLDLGCGTGYSLIWLRDRLAAEVAVGVDASEDAAEFWRLRGLDTVALGSARRIPLRSDYFDLVTCFDVIYQLDFEGAGRAVEEMHRVLKPGGMLFIREPAYDWMRGSHDIAVATRHRFTRGEMRRLLGSQGFRVIRSTYANTLLFPLAVPHRLLSQWRGSAGSDVKPVPGWINGTLLVALLLEARLVRAMSFPFGLSVISVARKHPG